MIQVPINTSDLNEDFHYYSQELEIDNEEENYTDDSSQVTDDEMSSDDLHFEDEKSNNLKNDMKEGSGFENTKFY